MHGKLYRAKNGEMTFGSTELGLKFRVNTIPTIWGNCVPSKLFPPFPPFATHLSARVHGVGDEESSEQRPEGDEVRVPEEDRAHEGAGGRQQLREAGRPPPPEPVQPPGGQQVRRQLQQGGDGEGGVDGVPQVGDVADVAVEHPGDQHPGDRRAPDQTDVTLDSLLFSLKLSHC